MFLSIVNITLRIMKGLHVYTSPTYTGLFIAIVTIIGFWITGTEYKVLDQLTFSWQLLLLFIGIVGCAALILKTKSFQYEKAGRLGMLNYLSVIFTFLFDSILIGTKFSANEIYGIIIILGANIISAYTVFK